MLVSIFVICQLKARSKKNNKKINKNKQTEKKKPVEKQLL